MRASWWVAVFLVGCGSPPPYVDGGGGSGGSGGIGGSGGTGGTGGVACVTSCANKECGDDGCGGACGACEPTKLCSATGTCVAVTFGSSNVVVDATSGRHPIAPEIYGMSFATAAQRTEVHLGANRWGGNAVTRYNWKLDVHNTASDWYFENILDSSDTDYNKAGFVDSADAFLNGNHDTATPSVFTLPTIGWTPNARVMHACSYPVNTFGQQQDQDPGLPANETCGNGKDTTGTPLVGADPKTTSVAVDAAFTKEWLDHLVATHGLRSAGGTAFYTLDNEMNLWSSTHRDVHPVPTDSDEIWQKTVTYAPLIRAADPGATILGFGTWGVLDVFLSNKDTTNNNTNDKLAHGNIPLLAWYLQQLAAYEAANHVRLVDCVDLHYYSQSNDRLVDMRSLWDPTYPDPSWINGFLGEPVRLLPRVQEWIQKYYPGTRICITEYNPYFQREGDPDAALATAEMMGIFGKYGVRLANYWTNTLDQSGKPQPPYQAFRMFRNYDGASGQFATVSVGAATNLAETSVYAASSDATDVITLVLIHTATSGTTAKLELRNFTFNAATPTKVFVYTSAAGKIVAAPDLTSTAGVFTVSLPAKSMTLLRIAKN